MALERNGKKVGRPSIDSEAINVRCERSMLNAIDDWRIRKGNQPTRPKAVRLLLRRALLDLGFAIEGNEGMTAAERELLLFLAQMVAHDISKELQNAGLKPNEGVGGAQIRKIIALSETVQREDKEE